MTARDTSDDAYMMRPKRGARVTYRRNKRTKLWRWQLQAANFEFVSGGGGQRYPSLSAAQRGYKAMVAAVMRATEVIVDD